MTEELFRVDLLNKRTGYDQEMLKDMFDMFRGAYPEYFTLISQRIQDENWVGVSEIAHRAKSAVAIMGMETVREEFAEMEALTQNGDPVEDCQTWLDKLDTKVKLAIVQIEKYIDELK